MKRPKIDRLAGQKVKPMNARVSPSELVEEASFLTRWFVMEEMRGYHDTRESAGERVAHRLGFSYRQLRRLISGDIKRPYGDVMDSLRNYALTLEAAGRRIADHQANMARINLAARERILHGPDDADDCSDCDGIPGPVRGMAVETNGDACGEAGEDHGSADGQVND